MNWGIFGQVFGVMFALFSILFGLMGLTSGDEDKIPASLVLLLIGTILIALVSGLAL